LDGPHLAVVVLSTVPGTKCSADIRVAVLAIIDLVRPDSRRQILAALDPLDERKRVRCQQLRPGIRASMGSLSTMLKYSGFDN
jgi:hypothetical protein